MQSKISRKLNRKEFWVKLFFLILSLSAFTLSENALAQSPKTVRFVYFVPADKAVNNEYKAALTDAALHIQDFYQREIGNGYTFRLNNPIVEVYQLPHVSSWYSTNNVGGSQSNWFYVNLLNDAAPFTGAVFNDANYRWAYFIDADAACNQTSVAAVAGIAFHGATVLRGLTKQAGLDPCPDGRPEVGRHYRTLGGIAHEVGHALGRPHPSGCDSGACTGGAYAYGSLMNVGFLDYPNTYFLPEDKQFFLTNSIISGFFAQQDLRPPQNFDFDNDRKSDVSVWRPTAGFWHILQSTNEQTRSVNWGIESDKIVPGDYDGDRKTDLAVWRPDNATWYILRSSDNVFTATQFGQNTDIPVAADFDGDLKTDIAVWRPGNGFWYVIRSATNVWQTVQFGSPGDIPLTGDFNGDKRADFAVWRNRSWYILNYYMSSATTMILSATQYGLIGDKLVPGDYDGDKKTDIAVWRPTDGTWYISQNQNNFTAYQFGANGDIPAPGDYDGDGKTDIVVWRPTNGFWYLRQSTNGYREAYYGTNGDIPVCTYVTR